MIYYLLYKTPNKQHVCKKKPQCYGARRGLGGGGRVGEGVRVRFDRYIMEFQDLHEFSAGRGGKVESSN